MSAWMLLLLTLWSPVDDARPATDGGKSEQERAREMRKKQRELSYARLQRDLDQMAMEAALEDGELEVQRARDKLEQAQVKLGLFHAEREVALRKEELQQRRAEWNVEAQRQELAELQAMYEAEEFAELTKELVLQRGQVSLEFARTSLEIQQQESEHAAAERDQKSRELERGIHDAEIEVMKATHKLERVRREQDLKMLKSQHGIEELEEDLARLQSKAKEAEEGLAKKVEELERALNDLREAMSGGRAGEGGEGRGETTGRAGTAAEDASSGRTGALR